MREKSIDTNNRHSWLMYASLGIGALLMVAAAQPVSAQEATVSPAALAALLRGENAESRAIYKTGREAEDAGNHKVAAAAYKAALTASPEMIEALNDLAYLQATSEDESVRNPGEAVANGEKLIDMAERRLVQRRQYRGADNVTNLYANLPLPASFYKVTMLNTVAAAYAAAGKFHSTRPSRWETRTFAQQKADTATINNNQAAADCADEAMAATSMASMAVEAAEALATKQPTAQHAQILATVRANLSKIEAGQALHGVRQVREGDWISNNAPQQP